MNHGTLMKEAESRLAELILFGFKGLELEAETRRFLKEEAPAGVIHFAHNYESPAQMLELNQSVQELSPTDLPFWISVDHEGGRVQRFRKGFTKLPEAALYAQSDSPQLLFEISQHVARELAAVGINLNFAPVADLQTNPKNPVIGKRAFGESAEEASRWVTAWVRGHLKENVQPCVKHFPGHGDTSVDSHFALPKVDTPLELMRTREFLPFQKAFKSGCNFVMSAHIVCPDLDPERPATLSEKILLPLLRQELRFTGVILSDDMEMKAIADHFGDELAPGLAIRAGCDALLYRSEEKARIGLDGLRKALHNGSLAPERILDAVRRTSELRKECLNRIQKPQMTELASRVGLEESAALVAQFLTQA
jgi:beta-N-acetylhexosaminidase